jgi:glycosyltransferase involved in cell wall biosynthesis
MNFYSFSTLCSNYDSHAHCDVHIAYGLADGFQALGQNSTVLWGGETKIINKILHKNWKDVNLGEDDCLIYYSEMMGDTIYDCNLSSAGLRIWYPSYTPGCDHDFWDYIMIDNETYVEEIQEKSPFTKVIWSMFGCPNDIGDHKNPYPRDGRNLFYAGRLMEKGEFSHVSTIQKLADMLPAGYQIWIASACVWIPCDYWDKELAGKVAYSPLGLKVDPYSSDAMYDYYYLEYGEFKRRVGNCINRDNVNFLGPMAYGSFDGYIQHADCIIDFGFNCNAPGPNCKIMEPLRYGTPIVADGISFSFPLIEKYGQGHIVPYRDIRSMVQAIRSIPKKDYELRRYNGELFNKRHSWRARAGDLMERVIDF